MNISKIKEKNITKLIENLKKTANIFGPQKKEHQFSFEKIHNSNEIDLKYNTSILPPSKIFFPNNETLIETNLKTYETKSVLEKEPKVLFGVHPCDIQGINIMDSFMSKEPGDLNYNTRRELTTIIGLQCIKPCTEKTLCYDKKTLFTDKYYDIMLWDATDYYIVETKSEQGETLIENNRELFEKLDENTLRKFKEHFRKEQEKHFKKRLIGKTEDLKEALENIYNSEVWNKIGEKCFSCTSCTVVCPTCYCFDVKDEVDVNLNTAKRCRTWDSCQECSFSLIGTGENFRETVAARNRHRVFKKEVYAMKNFGFSGCVGCGRCNETCVADISLIEIYNQALSYEII